MKQNQMIGAACLILALILNWGDHPGLITPSKKSPLPGEGYHQLIIEKKADRERLPPEQKDAIFSADIDEMVRAAGGRRYVYDPEQDLSKKDDQWVLDAMKLPRGELPWLIHDFNGNGESIAMPKNPKDMKERVQAILGKK